MHYFAERVRIFNMNFKGSIDSFKCIKLLIPHLVNLNVNHSFKNYLLRAKMAANRTAGCKIVFG